MQSQEIHQALIWSPVLSAIVWRSHTGISPWTRLMIVLKRSSKLAFSSSPGLSVFYYSFIAVMSTLPRWFVKWILPNAVSSYCHSYKPRNQRLLGGAENSWLVTGRQRTHSYAKLRARLQSLIGRTMGSLLCETSSVDAFPPLVLIYPKSEWNGLKLNRSTCFPASGLASRWLWKWLCRRGV